MSPWKFLLSGALSATFAVPPALAGQGGKVIEIVTFKLKAGVSAAEFARIDKAVEREHVAKQPGFDEKMIRLAPGMNLTAEIKTEKRRVIEYSLSPIQKAASENLRER